MCNGGLIGVYEMNTTDREYRQYTARTLAEYECKIKELNDQSLLTTFDGMTNVLFSVKDESARKLACNALDIIANEMYNRKLKKAH